MRKDITAFPLQWPVDYPRTTTPQRSRFGSYSKKPSVEDARHKLLNELRMMRVESVVMSMNIKRRKDGLPYSNQPEPSDRGVACYFKYNDTEVVIACDTYDKVGCNLYAIALTIEAMRGIERWGCSDFLNRAFTGFQALPERGSGRPWWEILGCKEDASDEFIKHCYRELVKQFHPDNPVTGDPEKFRELQEAYESSKSKKEIVL